MLTLFHGPKSRSGSTVWLLEELGVPYETKVVDIRRADGSGARDSANPHPHSKVPCLQHDGLRVFETAAITLYLTDLFPDAISLGGTTNLLMTFKLMNETAVLKDYAARITDRPAYRRMMERDGAR